LESRQAGLKFSRAFFIEFVMATKETKKPKGSPFANNREEWALEKSKARLEFSAWATRPPAGKTYRQKVYLR
jgi:hypothetical protein